MTEEREIPRTLAEEAQVNEILRKKIGIMVAIPNMGSKICTPLMMWIQSLDFKTIDAACPYFFKVFMPNDCSPVEYARNQCVRAFLADPFWKKLWFIDADMNPPFNALDLLDYDAPIVSGLTYIWHGEDWRGDGTYRPPYMKINAFDYQPESEDFKSKLPPRDARVFECDAAGSACLVIRRDVLEDMPEPWFRTPRDPYGQTLRSEDLDFGLRCMRSGRRTLYVPKVQFGHIKEVDLSHITKYGMASLRTVIDQIKALPPEQQIAALPDIRFPGEPEKEQVGPKSLAIVHGGRR